MRQILMGVVALGLLASLAVAQDQDAKQDSSKVKTASAKVEKDVAQKEKKAGKNDWLIKHPTILKLLELNNQERARIGYPGCTLNAELCVAAQQHAEWMAETGYYMHSNLPWPEIIFSGPLTPEDATNGWIWSPAHYSIMVSGSEAGFGYAVRDGYTYWVGLFQ